MQFCSAGSEQLIAVHNGMTFVAQTPSHCERAIELLRCGYLLARKHADASTCGSPMDVWLLHIIPRALWSIPQGVHPPNARCEIHPIKPTYWLKHNPSAAFPEDCPGYRGFYSSAHAWPYTHSMRKHSALQPTLLRDGRPSVYSQLCLCSSR